MTIEALLKRGKNLENNSRRVKAGDIFLAYPGEKADGRDYIADAINNGAIAVIYEPANYSEASLANLSLEVPLLAYPHLADKLGYLASKVYPVAENALQVTGVTGTNGKTSVAYQLTQAHALLGNKAAYMGTLGAGELEAIRPLQNTTPDALCIQKIFYQWAQEGIKRVAMEVSSHGLSEGRVAGVLFKQAIYTNLSHEHLDYHKTLAAYAKAKSKLFAYPSLKSVILNQDDKHVSLMQAQVSNNTKVLTYGMHDTADVHARHVSLQMSGSIFEVKTPQGLFECTLKTVGLFNIYNSLAVITSLIADGYTLKEIASVIPKLVASPGRMERIAVEPNVLVDYAHTPDALEKVLETLAVLKKNKLIVVFGCGGDRDKEKRPLMAQIAEKYADEVIVTSDNPRTEDPHQILKEIAIGFHTHRNVTQIENRKDAIEFALQRADAEDIILIAGKGHEAYQEIQDVRYPFSDAAVVREFLRQHHIV